MKTPPFAEETPFAVITYHRGDGNTVAYLMNGEPDAIPYLAQQDPAILRVFTPPRVSTFLFNKAVAEQTNQPDTIFANKVTCHYAKDVGCFLCLNLTPEGYELFSTYDYMTCRVRVHYVPNGSAASAQWQNFFSPNLKKALAVLGLKPSGKVANKFG